MFLLEDLKDDLGDLLDWWCGVGAKVGGKNGRAAELQSRSNIAVNVRDSAPNVSRYQ